MPKPHAFLALVVTIVISGPLLGQPITVSLERVEDPTLPPIPAVAWRQALALLPVYARELEGLDLSVEDRGSRTVADFMESQHVKPGGVDLGRALSLGAEAARAKFEARIRDALGGVDLGKTLDYVTAGRPETDRARAAHALASLYAERSQMLARELDRTPRTFPGEALMTTWGGALVHETDADVIVTNVPLLYRPEDGVALHALIRGGMVGGFTTFQGGRSGYGGCSVASTFELSSFLPSVRAIGGEALAPDSMGRPLAAILAHELTHLLLHLGDNYDHDRCLMHPPSGLDYDRFWFHAHTLSACPRCAPLAAIRLASLRARIEERAGHIDRALARYHDAIQQAPGDADLLNEAAWMCAVSGLALDQGLAWARRAMLASPGSGAILDTLGWIYFEKGNARRAQEWLDRARAIYAARGPVDAVVTYHLSCVAMALGHTTQAAALAREALKGKLSDRAVATLSRIQAGAHQDLAPPAQGSS